MSLGITRHTNLGTQPPPLPTTPKAPRQTDDLIRQRDRIAGSRLRQQEKPALTRVEGDL